MEFFRYAYLIADLVLLLVWIALFVVRKDLRKEMLIMSLCVSPMGPIAEFFYLRDYWHPALFNGWTIGIEDFIFAFVIGGIASVVYEEFFKRKYMRKNLRHHHSSMFLFIGGAVHGFCFAPALRR